MPVGSESWQSPPSVLPQERAILQARATSHAPSLVDRASRRLVAGEVGIPFSVWPPCPAQAVGRPAWCAWC